MGASMGSQPTAATATGIEASIGRVNSGLGTSGTNATYASRKKIRMATPTMTAKATQRPQLDQEFP